MNKEFLPPKKAIENTKLGLYLHKKYNRGGLTPEQAEIKGVDSGITRAYQIISNKPLSPEIIKKMAKFNRHRRNYRPNITLKDSGPTAGTIAWLLWGGNEGINWALSFKNKF